MWTSWTLPCGLVLAVMLASADTRAQSQAAADPCDAFPECAARAEHARSLVNDGKYEDAFRAYQIAYALRQSPKLLFNMARTLHKAGRLTEAADYYQHYLDDGKGEPAEQRSKAADYRAGILAELKKTMALPPGNPSPPATDPPPEVSVTPASTRYVPAWRISSGVAIGAVGIVLVGFAASGLALHGQCRQQTEAAWQAPLCVEQYNTLSPAGALLGTGIGLAVSGVLMAAIPQKRSGEAATLQPSQPVLSAGTSPLGALW